MIGVVRLSATRCRPSNGVEHAAPFVTVPWNVNETIGKTVTERYVPLFEQGVDERATSAALSRDTISPPSPSAARAANAATAARRARSPTGRRATRGSAADRLIKILPHSVVYVSFFF